MEAERSNRGERASLKADMYAAWPPTWVAWPRTTPVTVMRLMRPSTAHDRNRQGRNKPNPQRAPKGHHRRRAEEAGQQTTDDCLAASKLDNAEASRTRTLTSNGGAMLMQRTCNKKALHPRKDCPRMSLTGTKEHPWALRASGRALRSASELIGKRLEETDKITSPSTRRETWDTKRPHAVRHLGRVLHTLKQAQRRSMTRGPRLAAQSHERRS